VCELRPDSGGQHVCAIGYLDGIEVARSTDTELVPPLFPDNDCWLQLFNSRSSETDGGGVFIGHMAGLKVWNNVALTPAEIFAEMWSYWPVRRLDVWAVVPMINKASAGFNYVGSDFTVQGVDFIDGRCITPRCAPGVPVINSANRSVRRDRTSSRRRP
jgi:hypothetical protein